MDIVDSSLVAAITDKPQADYITPTGVAVSPNQKWVEQPMTSRNFIKKNVEKFNDKGYTNGQDMATETWNGKHSTELAMPFDPTFQNIGRFLLAICGSTTPSAASSLFSNLFKLLDLKVSQQLPAYGILGQATPANGGLNVKANSMVGKSLKLSGDGAARCKGEMQWLGSGEYIQPSGITWGTHVKSIAGTQVPIYNTTSKLVRSDAPGGGNAVNKSLCQNLGWEIGITNQFAEDDYGCPRFFDPTDIKKGILRSQLLLQGREITSRWKFKLAQNSTEMSLLENNAPLKLFFSLISTETLTALSHALNFDFPLNTYKTVDHSSENGFVYLTIEPETLFSKSAGYAMQAELINDVELYT